MFKFKGKRLLVLGLKESGVQVTKLLNQHGYELDLADQILTPNEVELDFTYNTYVPYDLLIDKITTYDVIIKSPGIPDHNPIIKQAIANNLLVLSEIEVAYHFLPPGKKLIAVTGTNGKTTTTTLITKILTTCGLKACSCGNIGYTLSEAILVDIYDYFVCECSSFQLKNSVYFTPDVAVFLNITPNHLDYHRDFADYLNSKLKITQNLTEKSVLIYNEDDSILKQSFNDTSFPSLSFSLIKKVEAYFLKDIIYLNDKRLIDTKQLHLLGKENVSNIMAALLATSVFNLDLTLVKEAIYDFKPLKYRIEYLNTINGVKFYNDSKSTNSSATLTAVQALTEPLILLMGGVLKEDNYGEILANPKIKTIIAFGANRNLIKEQADKVLAICFVCLNLLEALRLVRKLMTEGDTVLFSPGAQSFDQYQNYVERGEAFQKLVETVIKF